MNQGQVADSYAIVDVSCGDKSGIVGGLLGYSDRLSDLPPQSSGIVERCYAAGAVAVPEPNEVCGALIGVARGTIDSCYFLAPSEGRGSNNGIGIPLADTQMRQRASFIGWDFDQIWAISEGRDYPRLKWEMQ